MFQTFVNYLAYKFIPYRRWLIGVIIACVTLSISFFGNSEKTNWLWEDKPYIPVIFILAALFLSNVFIRLQTIIHEAELKKVKRVSENPMDMLSFREQEVVKLILEQKNNQEIADQMHVEISTVKTHINRIYKELGLKNRKELLQLFNS